MEILIFNLVIRWLSHYSLFKEYFVYKHTWIILFEDYNVGPFYKNAQSKPNYSGKPQKSVWLNDNASDFGNFKLPTNVFVERNHM